MKVLVVGSVAYDDVETFAGSVRRVLGGSATFFSMASSLFAPTQIVAVVGDDFDASDLDRITVRGVDTGGVARAPGATFRWGGRYDPQFRSRETLFTELNVFAQFDPQLPVAYRESAVVFLANIHPTLQLSVLDQARRPKIVACDTMNFWIHGEPAALKAVLRRVDILFVNDEEALALTGEANMLHAARCIRAMGPATVVIKRGEHGAWLFHGDHITVVPAVPLATVVDPTGAGDTFAGGFMGFIAHALERGSILDGALYAQAMVAGTLTASFAVEGFSIDAIEAANIDRLTERHARLCAAMAPRDLPW